MIKRSSAQLVLDMGADDVVECRLRLEAERARARGVEAARPSRRRCAPPVRPARGGCARRPCRRRRGAAPRSARRPCSDTPGMVRLMRGPSCSRVRPAAWMRKPTAERGLACQCSTLSATGSSASWPASGSRMMPEKKPEAALFGLPGRTHDRRQADADAVEKAAPRVVGEQQFADRLLRAVGGERRQMEIVGDGVGKRRAEHRDRRGEHEFRLVAVADCADRFQQRAGAVEIDAVALLEIGFRLARDHAGEMEDHVRPFRDRFFRDARRGEIGGRGS